MPERVGPVDPTGVRPALLALTATLALAAVTPALAGDGKGGASRFAGLVASCRASSSGDAWKACVRSKLGADTTDGPHVDPGPGARPPRPACASTSDQKPGSGCGVKPGALVGSCASSTGADGKACAGSKRGRPDRPPAAPDPSRIAQAVCNGPLGRKLGSGCVDTITQLFATCAAQASSGRDAVRACLRNGLASAVRRDPAPTG
jgi:hypothetical protein